MSFLRGSPNYVWSTTGVLGKGATGAVFQGVNKHNGTSVAVKTFNNLSHTRPHIVQLREFEVLKKVKHENIVKLLAIEEETDGRGKVIVMELCTGGSLFCILDDPENTYGLQEDEFLLVLEHLSAGMKHLRDNNLIHRDLKPGNIMKFVSDDGRNIYKLTDFGAARELEENEQFISLYGTEEYLHPDMYGRAVLGKPVGKKFKATVDLWSIGVTLYHVATGNLPFRPYGGRRNKETMYYITTKKASGVISGTQSTENGPIDWCRSLPKSCQLSDGLKKYITPLLAGLLEVESQKILSFEKFFTEVTKILSRKKIFIFHIHKIQSVRIYLGPDETFNDLKNYIFEQTDVRPCNQILLFDKKHLNEIITEDSFVFDYINNTSDENPIILFSNENNNVVFTPDYDLPKLPTFHGSANVDNDASIAKSICSIAHASKRLIDKMSLASKLTHESVNMFTSIVKQELLEVYNKCNKILELTNLVEKTAECLMRNHITIATLLDGNSPLVTTDWKAELDRGVYQELKNGLGVAIKQLYGRYCTEDTLTKEYEKNSASFQCCWKSRASQRAHTYVQRLRDSWQHMIRDRATRTLTYNDEQFHVLERIKMDVMGNNLVKNLLEQEVVQSIMQTAECLADWYKMAQTIYLQGKILDKDIDSCKQRLEFLLEHMERCDKEFSENIFNKDIVINTIKHKGKIKGEEIKSLRSSITEIHNKQDEINDLIMNNVLLINDFQTLIKKIDDEDLSELNCY